MNPNSPHPYYLLGIINSLLITWYHHKRNPKAQKLLFPKLLVSDLGNLPIRTIDFTNPAEVKQHDRMVALVERMLELHKQHPLTSPEQERLARDIASTDREIDTLVYQLYDLTPEEIKIVES